MSVRRFLFYFPPGSTVFLSGGWYNSGRVMQMRTVVYGDILLAVNWIVDYFLLVGVAALTGCGAARGRLLLGGALGGASAFVFLAPPLPWWGQAAYQLVTGTLVLLVAFRVRRLRSFLRLWFWYFLLNLCYTGLVLAAVYWLSFSAVRQNNMAFYYDVSPLLLVGCIAALYLLLRLVLLLLEPARTDKIVRAEIDCAGETLHAELLIDSGLSAQDVLLEQPLLLLSWPDTLGSAANTSVCAAEKIPVCAAAMKEEKGETFSAQAASVQGDGMREKLNRWFSAPQGAALSPGLRLVPLHTAAGPLLAPALTAKAVINSRPAVVTLAFCGERLCGGRVQGLFGAKSYEMIGGR